MATMTASHIHTCRTGNKSLLSRCSAFSANARLVSRVSKASEKYSFGVIAETGDPLLVRAVKGEKVQRAPAWMMRQAGRYQACYRELAKKHPSFRERSENADLVVQISLQPYSSFRPDGIILFSDILTPLPHLGVDFEIDDVKGPVLDQPITTKEGLSVLRPIDMDKLHFVGEALSTLRKEAPEAAVLGFVGSPWTLATYIVEGKSSRIYKTIKVMMRKQPELLHAILNHVALQITEYVRYQIDSGAQVVQIFDSWGGQLTPQDWDVFSKPYLQMIVDGARATHPDVPLTLYANGSGGLLERMASTGVDCVGLDWSVDMADARTRLGDEVSLQGNVDPIVLFSDEKSIEAAVRACSEKGRAGNSRHVLNLGHGVIVGTPEENVAAFFDANRRTLY